MSHSQSRNFSAEERTLLISLVEQDKNGQNILFGRFSSGITKQKKNKKWDYIAAEINKLNGRGIETEKN